MPPLFASYSSLNATRLMSPEVDALIAEAMATGDDVARWELLVEAERAAMAQWILVPVAVAHSNLVFNTEHASIGTRADGSIDVTTLQ